MLAIPWYDLNINKLPSDTKILFKRDVEDKMFFGYFDKEKFIVEGLLCDCGNEICNEEAEFDSFNIDQIKYWTPYCPSYNQS